VIVVTVKSLVVYTVVEAGLTYIESESVYDCFL